MSAPCDCMPLHTHRTAANRYLSNSMQGITLNRGEPRVDNRYRRSRFRRLFGKAKNASGNRKELGGDESRRTVVNTPVVAIRTVARRALRSSAPLFTATES
jgi:hypothetical protein